MGYQPRCGIFNGLNDHGWNYKQGWNWGVGGGGGGYKRDYALLLLGRPDGAQVIK